jgi:hypothetical protein
MELSGGCKAARGRYRSRIPSGEAATLHREFDICTAFSFDGITVIDGSTGRKPKIRSHRIAPAASEAGPATRRSSGEAMR